MKNFHKTRMIMYFLIYFGYMFFYMGRKCFLFALPWVVRDLGFSLSEIGVFISIISISYGIGKFINGIVVDFLKKSSLIMSIGLVGVGVSNLIIGYAPSFYTISIMCAINGFMQSMGWPPCSRVLSGWFEKSIRGRYWSFWSTSYAVGEAITPWIIEISARKYGWKTGVFFISGICICFATILSRFLLDTPGDIDLGENNSRSSKDLSMFDIIKKSIFNKNILILAVAYMCVQFIRTALADWMMVYMSIVYTDTFVASMCSSAFGIGGLIGLPIWGFISDKYYSKLGTRIPVVLLALIFLTINITLWKIFVGYSILLDVIFALIAGTMIFGPQMLGGLISVDIFGEDVAGTITGFIGMFAYLGSTLAGAPIGRFVDVYGWNVYHTIILTVIIIALILHVAIDKKIKVK